MKSYILSSLMFIVVVSMLTIGCEHQPPITPNNEISNSNNGAGSSNNNGGTGNSGNNGNSGVCFETDILPLFIANCSQAGCHGNGSAQEGVVLDNYNGIMRDIRPGNPNNSKNYTQIISGQMPYGPNTKLTSSQTQIIKQWINEGALNTVNCSNSGTCDTVNVTYSNQVSTAMQKFCNGCHSGNPPQGGIDLTTYANVKAQVDLGKLWGSVNWNIGLSRMPKGGIKIPSCELTQIKKWIDAGALNN